MSEKKFTYLFGAGASAKELPTVADFPDRMHKLYKKRIVGSGIIGEIGLKDDYQRSFDKILDEIGDLAIKIKQYSSIDTYAKILYLKNEKEELKKLKRILSNFLTLEQSYTKNDIRYDLFFASYSSLKEGQLTLPNNIKILSWNYDYQLELSFSKFKSFNFINEIDTFLNISPSGNTYNLYNPFSIYKLNGTAFSLISDGKFSRNVLISEFETDIDSLKINKEAEKGLVQRISEYQFDYRNNVETGIHFAWENDPIPSETRKRALEATKDTNILVVIGYSFPVFNREIDREIIYNMSNLEKVYIQIPENDIESVTERFRAIKDFSIYEDKYKDFITPITNKDEFIVPYEYGISQVVKFK